MRNFYNKVYKEADDSFFDELYTYNPDLWRKLEDDEKPDPKDLVFSGRLYIKNPKTKKWMPYHFELYSDKLVRTLI